MRVISVLHTTRAEPHTPCTEIILDYASTAYIRCAELPVTLDSRLR